MKCAIILKNNTKGEHMAPVNGSSEFPVMISKAAEADWSYHGNEWGRKYSSMMDSNNNGLGLSRNSKSLSGSWISSQGTSAGNNISHSQTSFSPSDLMGVANGYHGDFEDSLSSLLQDKLRLPTRVPAICESRTSLQSLERHPFDFSELEWQTIGSLLPTDDELFSSAINDHECSNAVSFISENEDLDLFSSGGGLELEGDAQDADRVLRNGVESLSGSGTVSGVGEHPFGEHPSRTLFVRNINSSVEDSELRALFEQYGEIRTLYTACKHRGFVMISYYDIRAARSAMRSLQNKALRRRKLDIHFSIPKDNPSDKDVNQGTLVVFNLDASVSNDELLQIFGVYGEVKEIRETPHKRHHKFIEFYDVRSAEAALRALNKCDIAGKRIKLEPSRPGGARRSLLQHLTPELDQEEGLNSSTSSLATSKSPLVHDKISNSFLDRIVAVESENSLGYMGHSTSYCRPKSFSEFGHTLLEAVHHSPSSTISTLRAQLISNHLMKMGHVPTQSLQSCTMETTTADRLLATNLNSVYRSNTNAQVFGTSGLVSHSPLVDVTSSNRSSPSYQHHHHSHHVGSAPIAPFPHIDRQQMLLKGMMDGPHPIAGSGVGFGRKHSIEPQFSSSLGCVTPNTILNNGLVDNAGYRNLWLMAQQQSKGSTYLKPAHDVALSFGCSGSERGRGRKTDSALSQNDKKQYELDIERIIRGEDVRTTLMIKNIPNKYTSKMLLAAIDELHKGTYDFIYLPIDFKNKCNVGYAFINMTEPSKIVPFYQAFNGKRWEKFNSEKVASLAYARIQGKAALIAHFQNSSLMNEDKRCRPILFHSGGPNVGDQEPFPVGPNPRVRMGKSRGVNQVKS